MHDMFGAGILSVRPMSIRFLLGIYIGQRKPEAVAFFKGRRLDQCVPMCLEQTGSLDPPVPSIP